MDSTSGERDPFGTDPHSPGAKLDDKKLRPNLVLGDFSLALTAVTAVGTFGARKYTDSGWVQVPDGHARYSEAMMRHWLAEHTLEYRDPQSGLPHSAHLAWNALARLELELRARQERETKGQSSTTWQYCYAQKHCPAHSTSKSNCICWFDEGAGPMPAAHHAANPRSVAWREKP